MFWGRTESVKRLALIFCTFFADRRITEQFIQLFKKDTFLAYAQKNKAIEVNVAKNVRIPKSEKESGYHVSIIKKISVI